MAISNQHNQINYTYSGKELYSQYTNKYKFIKYTIYKKIYINSLNAQIQILGEMLSRDNLYNWQKHINSSWCNNKKNRRLLFQNYKAFFEICINKRNRIFWKPFCQGKPEVAKKGAQVYLRQMCGCVEKNHLAVNANL